jgi:hypothetical protein
MGVVSSLPSPPGRPNVSLALPVTAIQQLHRVLTSHPSLLVHPLIRHEILKRYYLLDSFFLISLHATALMFVKCCEWPPLMASVTVVTGGRVQVCPSCQQHLVPHDSSDHTCAGSVSVLFFSPRLASWYRFVWIIASLCVCVCVCVC